MNGRRARGRPRTTMTDNIKDWTGMTYHECVRTTQNRDIWRLMTADLLRADGKADDDDYLKLLDIFWKFE